jgi:hypothetical protein
MIADKENDTNTSPNKNRKQSLSETTIRKVFFSTPVPSCLFSPTIITAKGLYPPPIIILKALLNTTTTIPTKSLSVPIKLITMKEHPSDKENANKLKKSSSTPTITTLKKPTLIERLISPTKSETPTIRKIPRPSTSTRTAPNQTKMKRPSTHRKKTPTTEDEEDEPMTKPISQTEKRKRQAKRADQVKSWKVREEREAREARLVIRRQMVNGISKVKPTEPPPKKKKKKRVKFNFDKNSIIQLPTLLDNEEVT